MKEAPLKGKRLVVGSLLVLVLNVLSTGLFAQPVVTCTVSGGSGDYMLDFTMDNATPGTEGKDVYFFGVLLDGSVSSSPAGYYATSYGAVQFTEVANAPVVPYNDTWIDPTDTALPTGASVSGFSVIDTDAEAPASVSYFAFGADGGAIYTGPDNLNTGNPSNPFFEGNAVMAVPEATGTMMTLITGTLLWIGFGKDAFRFRRHQ